MPPRSDSVGSPVQQPTRDSNDAGRPRTNRRGFLAAIVAGSGGIGIAGCLAVDDSPTSDADEVPIVYGVVRADPDDPTSLEPREKTVPAPWIENLELAFDVQRQLRNADLAGFVGSFVIPGDYGEPTPSIAIQSTAEGIHDEVASLSDDVAFDVDVIEGIPDPTADSSTGQPTTVADLEDLTVPGGVFCGNEAVRGSLAPAVYDEATGDRVFATANHLYGGSGEDHRGEPLYLYGDDTRETVGRVRQGFLEADVVVADPTGGYIPTSEISDATPGTVRGQFTKHGLADLMAREKSLEMTAAISGRASGEIKGIDGTTVYTGNAVRTGQLLWGDESSFTDGDSGSVSYRVDPEDADHLLVAGFNNARTWWPGANFTWGTAAHQLRDAYGFVF